MNGYHYVITLLLLVINPSIKYQITSTLHETSITYCNYSKHTHMFFLQKLKCYTIASIPPLHFTQAN